MGWWRKQAYLAYGIPRNRLKRLSLLQKVATLKTTITTNKGEITSFFLMLLTCVDTSFTFVTNQFSDLHWCTLTEDELLTMSCRRHIKWDPILLMHKQSSIQFLAVVPTVLLRYFWRKSFVFWNPKSTQGLQLFVLHQEGKNFLQFDENLYFLVALSQIMILPLLELERCSLELVVWQFVVLCLDWVCLVTFVGAWSGCKRFWIQQQSSRWAMSDGRMLYRALSQLFALHFAVADTLTLW
jgi:hypothetical protein